MIRREVPAALLVLAQLAATPARAAGPPAAAGPTKQECVAANESAQDLRRLGQLREARKQLALCVSEQCPGPVREDCAQRLSEVDKATPTLVFVARDKAGNDMSAVLVTMDGLPFADSLDGSATQVDPGEHRFIFEGEGLPPTEKVVVVREGDKGRHVNVVLGGTVAEEPKEPADSLWSGSMRRPLAFGVGGAGALGIALGTILGLVAKSTYDQAFSECHRDPTNCNWQGAQDGQSARSQATASTVAFVAGVLLLGGGAALYFTAPKTTNISMGPAVGADGAGLRVRAAW